MLCHALGGFELFAEVLAFGSAIMAADEEYFPKTDKEGTKGASKK